MVSAGTWLTETREQKDLGEHAPVVADGTTVTMTSESRDHVEDDRVLDVAGTRSPASDTLGWMVGTKKTDSREQSDPADGDRCCDVVPPNARPECLLGMLGTEKTGTREHSDATEGDTGECAGASAPGTTDPLLALLGTEKTGYPHGEHSDH
jgi:hypothetical protein